MKIYVASSWRNKVQPDVVAALRRAGHEVYDFRHPKPGDNGFAWSDLEGKAPGMRADGAWQDWTPEEFRAALDLPRAREGFRSDMDALEACDACVLVLPCGRSAHLELGWAAGAGKRTAVLFTQQDEPELMYRMLHRVCVSVAEVLDWLAAPPSSQEAPATPIDCGFCGRPLVKGLCPNCHPAPAAEPGEREAKAPNRYDSDGLLLGPRGLDDAGRGTP